MLSKRMIETIVDNGKFHAGTKQSRDGRTVRALQRRGIIKNVRWSKTDKVWKWKFTPKGARLSRLIAFIAPWALDEIVRR